MAYPPASPLSTARVRPLVFSIVSLLGVSAPVAMAATIWPVTTCNDSGAGSLRAVIGAATTVSGDTINLSALACSTISLHTGAITIPQNNLTITGPAATTLTLTGRYNGVIENDRLFKHTGSGTLTVQNLQMKYGNLQTTTATAAGGCIYSKGTVQLQNVFMTSCVAHSVSGAAHGGGVSAAVHIGMTDSHVGVSFARSDSGAAHGGAVYSRSVSAQVATFDFNGTSALSDSRGGAIFSTYEVSLAHSTVSNNAAVAKTSQRAAAAGGIYLVETLTPSNTNSSLSLVSSTISDNYAGYAGGVLSQARHVSIFNSTIVNNTAIEPTLGESFRKAAAGLALINGRPQLYAVDVSLQSSLLANNTYTAAGPGVYHAPASFDLSEAYGGGNKYGHIIITGASNLVHGSYLDDAPLPGDTLTVCPNLGPLRFNGGTTKTVALLSHSAGIDSGNNSQNETEDQRGRSVDATPYLYPRQSNGISDIGAYEVNQADIVFNMSFDTCAPVGTGFTPG